VSAIGELRDVHVWADLSSVIVVIDFFGWEMSGYGFVRGEG
jgi:hypothetical protein